MSQGWNGALQADQTLFFVLEGVMVIVSVFALNLFHPGMAMRNAYHIKSAWKAEKKMASNSSDLA